MNKSVSPESPSGFRSASAGSDNDQITKKSVSETNGYERATQYIGEDASVRLAAVIDKEGLLLGNFTRGDIVAEDWAPLTLLFLEQSSQVLDRLGCPIPERVALISSNERIIIAYEDSFSLMVVCDRQQDDILNIRISQGLDIIRKYMADRYNEKLFVNAEKTYA
jgi:predicted regulator of Ras-like GTPase activity (Roadblock/LC7/MglB family)